MTNAPQTPDADQEDLAIITLEGEDGSAYQCQILDVFEFEGKEYGILLKLKGEGEDAQEDEEESLVIMHLIEKDNQSIFRTIESDEEFEKVVQFVEEKAREAASAVEE